MKQTLFLLALLTALTAGAQQNKKAVGGYGMATADLTYVNGKAAINIGGYGGVLVNHKWLFGISANNILFKQNVGDKSENFQFNQYGLYSEYRFQPAQAVHLSAGLTGAMAWMSTTAGKAEGTHRDGDFTFAIQPQVGMNVKIVKWMQARLHAGYRFTGNTNSTYYKGSNANGVNAGAGLIFGSF